VWTFAGRHSRYQSNASPHPAGAAVAPSIRPFQITDSVQLFHSKSMRRRWTTSPDRNHNLTRINTIALSRRRRCSVPSHAATSRSTSCADRLRGSLARRQSVLRLLPSRGSGPQYSACPATHESAPSARLELLKTGRLFDLRLSPNYAAALPYRDTECPVVVSPVIDPGELPNIAPKL
jgi:hypothetical protein